ncbi:MAG: tRNA threonylcarbamoyladenosine dehydratase [Clostridia bacterium]|nr:tRNA threonylcarbamoyladenosine dehydratase [Clostridia bacterium]
MTDNIWLQRQISLIGEDATEKLKNSSVLLFGVGGVGGACLEALVRSGIGKITAVDSDVIDASNLNRQLISTVYDIGMAKVDIAKKRAEAINPNIRFNAVRTFADESNCSDLISSAEPDFVIDAIDCVSTKILIAVYCIEKEIPIIEAMGTGNKVDPTKFEIADISKTSVCPLARVMRRELSKRGIRHLPVLYSTEQPRKNGMRTPASISFAPNAAGLIIASYVIRKLGEF